MAHTIYRQRTKNPMWLYEHNFATLSVLFPGMIHGEQDRLESEFLHSSVRMKVSERCKYTITLNIQQHFTSIPIYSQSLLMRIRLYTDARLAEVVSYQGKGRFKPKYTVPNEQMYSPDEKYQINHLLYDWLAQLSRYFKQMEKATSCC